MSMLRFKCCKMARQQLQVALIIAAPQWKLNSRLRTTSTRQIESAEVIEQVIEHSVKCFLLNCGKCGCPAGAAAVSAHHQSKLGVGLEDEEDEDSHHQPCQDKQHDVPDAGRLQELLGSRAQLVHVVQQRVLKVNDGNLLHKLSSTPSRSSRRTMVSMALRVTCKYAGRLNAV
jgi:hypothetical protein